MWAWSHSTGQALHYPEGMGGRDGPQQPQDELCLEPSLGLLRGGQTPVHWERLGRWPSKRLARGCGGAGAEGQRGCWCIWKVGPGGFAGGLGEKGQGLVLSKKDGGAVHQEGDPGGGLLGTPGVGVTAECRTCHAREPIRYGAQAWGRPLNTGSGAQGRGEGWRPGWVLQHLDGSYSEEISVPMGRGFREPRDWAAAKELSYSGEV